MARLHGSRGAVWLSLHAGDTPTQVTYQSDWTITITRNVIDVTTLADEAVRYVAGTHGISGAFNGWFDDATAQTYLAAADGLPRTLIVYPDFTEPGRYFSGSVLADYGAAGAVSAGASVTTTWVAQTGTFTVSGIYGSTYLAVY